MNKTLGKNYNKSAIELGKILLESGLPQVLGIEKDLKNSREGIIVLAGLLKEIVEGDVLDPNNLPHWEKTGRSLLKKLH